MTATAKAHELADELGVDVEQIEGSGKGGKVTVADVRRRAEATALGGMPDDLDARGRRIWTEVKAYLEDQELWEPVFGELLANYVRSVVGAADARAKIRETGNTTIGSQGQLVVHPEVKIRRDCELDTLRYAGALFITPEALQKHQAEAGEGDGEDEGLGF